MSEMWRMNCARVTGFDEAVTAKDIEIETLKAKVSESEASIGSRPMDSTIMPETLPLTRPVASNTQVEVAPLATHSTHASVPGKAPPVNEFSGEDPECLLEDWLPSLERARKWNAWSEEDRMIQLAGHLKGRALQEWNLLHPDQLTTFTQAIEALRSRLDSV